VKSATAQELHQVAKDWLSDGVYVLEIYPFPKLASAAADTVLRKSLPPTGKPPLPKFPKFERTTLSSDLTVILAQRTSVPLVNFNLLINAGYAADQFALPGTASLAMNMMDEGTTSRTALQISDELQMLGATIGTGSDLDLSSVNLSSLKSNLDKSLELYADVILNPSFPKSDFDRLQKLALAGIQRERMQPFQMALRVLPGLIYGKKHAYGLPFTGSGFESTVSKLTREDMAKFHQTWVKPNNATLVVVGNVSMSELLPKLERAFKTWKRGEIPTKNISAVRLAEKQTVYIMDKPGAEQSVILTAHIAPPQNNPDEIAVQTLNTALGGSFTSRINMNLRENKHWSYGAGTAIIPARAQRPFIIYGPVQTDKTKESMIEISKELNEIMGSRPPTDDEVLKVKNNLTLSLPGNWETNNAVLGSIVNIVRFGLRDDYYDTYPGKVRSLSTGDVGQAAKKLLHPVSLVWVVVGDKSKIEQGIRELKYGEVRFIDGDGNVIE
jgi:zinc protease